MKSKWGLSISKNQDGVDFRYFRKCPHFENISFELAAVDYSELPIFILIRFWEIRKFLTNGLRESVCIFICVGTVGSKNRVEAPFLHGHYVCINDCPIVVGVENPHVPQPRNVRHIVIKPPPSARVF
jgi:hypothetical protein